MVSPHDPKQSSPRRRRPSHHDEYDASRMRRRSPSFESERKRHRRNRTSPDHASQKQNAAQADRAWDRDAYEASRRISSQHLPGKRNPSYGSHSTSFHRRRGGASGGGGAGGQTGLLGNERGPTAAPPAPNTNMYAPRGVVAGGPPGPPGQHSSKSRRLYIGNLPFHAGLSDFALLQFFSALYVAGFRPNEFGEALPVVSFWLHADGKFGFMEMRGEQETVNMMQFNLVMLHGRLLKVNRPSDYRPDVHNPQATSLIPEKIKAGSVVLLCDKMDGMVAAPPLLVEAANAERIREGASTAVENGDAAGAANVNASAMASAILPAKENAADSHMVATGAMGDGKPEAVPSRLPIEGTSALETLAPDGQEQGRGDESFIAPNMTNGTENDNDTVAKEVELETKKKDEIENVVALTEKNQEGEGDLKDKSKATGATDEKNGKKKEGVMVISLQNLVTDADLEGDDEDYAELMEDIQDECSSYGKVESVHIPRSGPWKGTVFVEYQEADGATTAIGSLAKRVFDGRKVIAVGVKGCSTVLEAAERIAS